MSKALFVCYGGGHADALIPVMEYLRKNTDIEVEAIGINLAVEKMRKAEIPCKSLSDYLDIRSVELGFPLARKRHDFSSKVSFADSIAYYGFSMSDLIDEAGVKSAEKILRIYDRRTMFPQKTMMRILNQEKPDVVVTTTMNRFEAATLYAAGKLGIATVKVEDLIGRVNRTFPDKIQVDTQAEKEELMQRGFSEQRIILREEMENPTVISYCEKIHQRQLEMRPTAFAVLCDYAKQEIMKRGVWSASIHVTGQPAFDRHPWFQQNTSKEEVCRELSLEAGKPLLTFMSQPNAEREDVFKTFVKAVESLSHTELQVVVKLHPNEDGRIQRLILKEHNTDKIKLVKEMDARLLLAVSDVIVTVSSTTGLEAAVMGKPLVYLNVTDKEDYIPFEQMGIGLRCTNSVEAAECLKKILIRHEKLDFPELKKYVTDGKAAVRVGELIRKAARKELKPVRKVVIIVQARMGSLRLPGKVMKTLAGKPMIWHLVNRMRQSKLAMEVIVATSEASNNASLKEYMTKANIPWYEGSETDVLKRYVETAKKSGAEVIVRVTADNPLTSAVCIDQMIESHFQMNADYTVMKGLPIGVTGEVVNLEVLENVCGKKDLTQTDREHVTLYVYEHPDEYKINYMEAPKEINSPDTRLTVDTLEDFKRMEDIYEQLYKGNDIKLEDVLSYLSFSRLEHR